MRQAIRRCARTTLALTSALVTLACFPSPPARVAPARVSPDLGTLDRGIYEASGAVAPQHPVTGRPVLNIVPESVEIRLARDFWKEYVQEAKARGARIDPRGPRRERIRRLFGELTAVAHRPLLPWEVHYVEDPTPNAFTAGGGLVVLLEGLYRSGMLSDGDDDGVAAVLAHEIAHVAMLHPPTRVTWLGVGGVLTPGAKDPYYRAAYTLDQEAEADRLSVLYLALAGVDPLAASRLWERVAERETDSAGRAGYLHDHPVSRERVLITREAGEQVARYRTRGRNPRHREILGDNVLYPANRKEAYRAGDGVARAATAMIDSFRIHQRAARSRDERRAAVSDQARVRVLRSREVPAKDGSPGLALDVWNGASRSVSGMGVSLAYWSRGAMVYIEDCRARVSIAPRREGTVHCPRQEVEADRIEPRINDVSWR